MVIGRSRITASAIGEWRNGRTTIVVEVSVPGERWEVEFFEDGHLEIERFRSDGQIDDERVLEDLWRMAE